MSDYYTSEQNADLGFFLNHDNVDTEYAVLVAFCTLARVLYFYTAVLILLTNLSRSELRLSPLM